MAYAGNASRNATHDGSCRVSGVQLEPALMALWFSSPQISALCSFAPKTWPAVCPPRCIGSCSACEIEWPRYFLSYQTSQDTDDERPVELPPFSAGGERCPSAPHLRNQLLQALPSAEFEALCPHPGPVQLVRETVLVEAGAPLAHVDLPHSCVISRR